MICRENIYDALVLAAKIRVFIRGYMAHKAFMYINYMEKAKLWAQFLGLEKELVDELTEVCDFRKTTDLLAPDVCRRCKHIFSLTVGGRLRDYCHTCTIGYPKDAVSDYEIQQFSQLFGISCNWLQIFFAAYYENRHALR